MLEIRDGFDLIERCNWVNIKLSEEGTIYTEDEQSIVSPKLSGNSRAQETGT